MHEAKAHDPGKVAGTLPVPWECTGIAPYAGQAIMNASMTHGPGEGHLSSWRAITPSSSGRQRMGANEAPVLLSDNNPHTDGWIPTRNPVLVCGNVGTRRGNRTAV
jgi:hypothetical protein